MRTWLALALAAGLGLAGCCTRKPATDFNRFDGTANQPSGLCGIFSGFGTTAEPERWGAVYSPVTVEEYGELLYLSHGSKITGTSVSRVSAAQPELGPAHG